MSVELFLGPMFASKSTSLIARLSEYSYKHKCILIKANIDNRYSTNKVISHSKNFQYDAVNVDINKINSEETYKLVENYDVVGIDEGQFFAGIDIYADKLANNGKNVIVAALDGDSNQVPFGDIHKLIPKSEKKKFLKAFCSECGLKNAIWTKSLTKMENGEISVGTHFQPRCRKCFNL